MPDIPLLDREGKPLGPLVSYFTLQAIMYSPNDKDSVSSYLSLTDDGPTDLFKRAFLKLSKGASGGAVTGMVFLRLLQLKLHRPKDASIGKAVFWLSAELKQKSRAERRRLPTGRGYVQDLWLQFRPAAHLWGAAPYLSELGIQPGEDPEPFIRSLIQVSDELFEAATATKLDLGPDPWTLPDSYPRKPLNIKLPSPRTEVIELLAQYTASGRRS